MPNEDFEQRPEMAEIERQASDALPEDELEPADAAEQQDFGARNVIMSNALQGGASPAAGAVSSGGELGMQPTTDEELADDEAELPAHERSQQAERR